MTIIRVVSLARGERFGRKSGKQKAAEIDLRRGIGADFPSICVNYILLEKIFRRIRGTR